MRVDIDSAKCQGHGRCYSLAPEVYGSDDDGYGSVVAGDVPAGLEDKAVLGMESCPESAITIEP